MSAGHVYAARCRRVPPYFFELPYSLQRTSSDTATPPSKNMTPPPTPVAATSKHQIIKMPKLITNIGSQTSKTATDRNRQSAGFTAPATKPGRHAA